MDQNFSDMDSSISYSISQAESNITIRSNNHIYRRSTTQLSTGDLALVVIYSIGGILFMVLAWYVACYLKTKHLRHFPCVGSITKKRERKKELQEWQAQRDTMVIGHLGTSQFEDRGGYPVYQPYPSPPPDNRRSAETLPSYHTVQPQRSRDSERYVRSMASQLVAPPEPAFVNVTTGYHTVGGYQPLEQDNDLKAQLAPPTPLHNVYLAR